MTPEGLVVLGVVELVLMYTDVLRAIIACVYDELFAILLWNCHVIEQWAADHIFVRTWKNAVEFDCAW
jgi:hypothetical protein